VLTSNGSAWVSSAAAGGGMTKAINQTTHGFAVGDVPYYTGSAYAKAKTDADSTSEALGVVSAVADANNFTLTMGGYISGLSGLTAGTTYYVSDATAGLLTATQPTTVGHISKPMLVADSTTSGYVINMRGVTIAATSSPITSEVMVYNSGGQGSTAVDAVIFSTVGTNTGSDITYATSATAADTFTINTSGIYAITYVNYAASNQTFAISKNGSGATTAGSLARANRLVSGNIGANLPTAMCWTGHLVATDVIRAHTSGTMATSDDRIQFSIVRIA
jgi:hypothetical protein